MTGEEFLGGKAASAFTLEIGDEQGFFAARDNDAGFIGAQNFAGLAGWLRDLRVPDFEEDGLRLSGQLGERSGPRREGADAVPKDARGLRPIEAAILAGDFTG